MAHPGCGQQKARLQQAEEGQGYAPHLSCADRLTQTYACLPQPYASLAAFFLHYFQHGEGMLRGLECKWGERRMERAPWG